MSFLMRPSRFVSQTGTLWVWGAASAGNHGLGAPANRSVPTQVGTDTDWSLISLNDSGTNHINIKTDGTIWSWGGGANGRHGHGDTENRSSPIQLGSSTSWTAAGGGDGAQAIIGGGKLYTMGYNVEGALGHNVGASSASKSSPTQVGSATNWSKVQGGLHSFVAIKTDGTLWGWGAQQYGNIGDGTVLSRSIPTQVGSATNWTQIAATKYRTGAINSDGELYMWGRGGYGQLGQGDSVDRSVPTQVGTDTDWAAISINYGNCLALKDNGSLYVWGLGREGQLGNNTTGASAHVSSPIQVGDTTDFAFISMGNAMAKAVKTNGTLFVWGNNGAGQLGLGDVVKRSVPTQLGTDTNWGGVQSNSGNYNSAQVKV